ncbi:FHA domain-containing protein [Teredinibacter purpureus]|jgi:FOG: FHA domain|uniref:FHA domain-containing protein n=1 Tax=Teredinibacter purpureus TaxID=2731756 RepID=UPI0005F8830E|nr:FHA domain-containing protein [Teredinibacter purpureus]
MTAYTVGRGEDAHIVINDASVSSRHLTVERVSENYVRVIDLGSTNGTYVSSGAGKEKITQIDVQTSDTLFLGAFSIKVADLMGKIAQADVKPSAAGERDNEKGFSRYIRTEDGRYVRKES